MGCGGTKDAMRPNTAAPCPCRRPCAIEHQCGGVAAEYQECTVCFEPLCDAPCATLHFKGNRVCRHLIHQKCAESMQCAGRFHCPECRGQFDTVTPLPRLTSASRCANTKAWFDAVDVDGDERLDRNEVLTVLKAQYRLDWRKLEEHLDEMWQHWDQDNSGDLKYEELFAENGLIAYITGEHVATQFAVEETPPAYETSPPPPLTDSAGWFKYWDADGNGTLDMQEVQRALMKTFNLGRELHRVNTMRETLDAVWPLFDLDGNGEIDFQEFTSPNGLGETLALSVAMMDRKLPQSHITAAQGCGPAQIRRLASQTYMGQGLWAV